MSCTISNSAGKLSRVAAPTGDVKCSGSRSARDAGGPQAMAPVVEVAHLLRSGMIGGSDEAFDAGVEALRRELAPEGMADLILFDRMVLALDRLRRAAQAEADGTSTAAWARLETVAERSLLKALETLGARRPRRSPRWGQAAPLVCSPLPDLDEPIMPPPDGRPVGIDHDRREGTSTPVDDANHWRGRLTFDVNVSETSPVVRGTWVTAGQVVSMIIDGLTWDDILRGHPELTEDDIRACLTYTVEEDGAGW